jgi:hypothetical protein
MEKPSTPKKWYNNGLAVFLLLLLFFPVGLYGLWRGNAYSRSSKIVLTFFVMASLMLYCENVKKSSTRYAAANTLIPADETPSAAQYQAKVGEELSVGSFVYRVNDFYFAKSLGNEFSKTKADGIFLLVDLTLMNNDKESHTIDNSLFKLTDQTGTEFESSNEGSTALMMAGKETLFLKNCNPKIQKAGFLVFEVPEKAEYNLNLSGGFWSGDTGIVRLSK